MRREGRLLSKMEPTWTRSGPPTKSRPTSQLLSRPTLGLLSLQQRRRVPSSARTTSLLDTRVRYIGLIPLITSLLLVAVWLWLHMRAAHALSFVKETQSFNKVPCTAGVTSPKIGHDWSRSCYLPGQLFLTEKNCNQFGLTSKYESYFLMPYSCSLVSYLTMGLLFLKLDNNWVAIPRMNTGLSLLKFTDWVESFRRDMTFHFLANILTGHSPIILSALWRSSILWRWRKHSRSSTFTFGYLSLSRDSPK